MENLSKRVKEAREAQGLSIEDLSKQTLLSTSVIKDIEAGTFDKYKGEEPYVKNYLKKIASVLDLDGENLTQEYVALTQEIQLKELEAKKQKEEELVKDETTFVDKMGDTLKNIKPTKPIHRKKSVYEDHYIIRYVKYAVVFAIVVALILVIFYTVSSLQSGSSSSSTNDSNVVEGNVDKNTNKAKEQEAAKKKEEEAAAKKKAAEESTVITRDAPMDYSVKLTDDSPTFELKIEFVGRTWASMKVNGSDYGATFKGRIYNNGNNKQSMDAEPETVTLTFNKEEFNNLSLSLGYNRGHRFYINNKQVEIPQEDYSDSYAYFKLKLEK